MSDFTPNQLRFIDWLAQGKMFREPPTIELFAQHIGVNARTLYRWKKGQNGFSADEFWDAVNERSRELIKEAMPDIRAALVQQAAQGNFQHIKFAHELMGEYEEKSQHNVDGELVIKVQYDNTDD